MDTCPEMRASLCNRVRAPHVDMCDREAGAVDCFLSLAPGIEWFGESRRCSGAVCEKKECIW